MIVTSRRQTPGAKASFISRKSRAPYLGYAYEGLKHASRTYGFYKDIKPYLPETYLDKYTYKPHKRVAGYIGQKFWKKKRIPFYTSSYQQYQKSTKQFHRWSRFNKYICPNCKGRKQPAFNCCYRCFSRLYY